MTRSSKRQLNYSINNNNNKVSNPASNSKKLSLKESINLNKKRNRLNTLNIGANGGLTGSNNDCKSPSSSSTSSTSQKSKRFNSSSNLNRIIANQKNKTIINTNNKRINVNKHIISAYERGEKDIILKAFKFINQFVDTQLEVENNGEKATEEMIKFLVKRSHYEKVKDALEDLNISVKDIEDIVLEGDEIIQIDNSEN